MEPNPNWVNAPYSGAALLCVPVPPWIRVWSRKRRLRWIRRIFKQQNVKVLLNRFGSWYKCETRLGILPPGYHKTIPILFKREKYTGELDLIQQ